MSSKTYRYEKGLMKYAYIYVYIYIYIYIKAYFKSTFFVTEGFTRQFPFFLLNFNSNEMNDGMLLKFKDSYSIHITSCWSVFTDIGIRSTIKFRNGRFNKKIQVRGFRTNSVFS